MLIPKPWTPAVSASHLSLSPPYALKGSFPKPPNQDSTSPGVWAAGALCSWGLCTAWTTRRGAEPTLSAFQAVLSQLSPYATRALGIINPIYLMAALPRPGCTVPACCQHSPMFQQIAEDQRSISSKRFLSSYSETYIKSRLNYISTLNCGFQ